MALLAAHWLAQGVPDDTQVRQSRARDDIRALLSALLSARPEGARLPDTVPGLQALVDEGTLPRLAPDPWGRPYVYRRPGRERPFELFSLGPDGRESGDDIVHWNLYGGR
ncbi:MAG: type II secretion system protein GspG [Rubrivivax sp.]